MKVDPCPQITYIIFARVQNFYMKLDPQLELRYRYFEKSIGQPLSYKSNTYGKAKSKNNLFFATQKRRELCDGATLCWLLYIHQTNSIVPPQQTRRPNCITERNGKCKKCYLRKENCFLLFE